MLLCTWFIAVETIRGCPKHPPRRNSQVSCSINLRIVTVQQHPGKGRRSRCRRWGPRLLAGSLQRFPHPVPVRAAWAAASANSLEPTFNVRLWQQPHQHAFLLSFNRYRERGIVRGTDEFFDRPRPDFIFRHKGRTFCPITQEVL